MNNDPNSRGQNEFVEWARTDLLMPGGTGGINTSVISSALLYGCFSVFIHEPEIVRMKVGNKGYRLHRDIIRGSSSSGSSN